MLSNKIFNLYIKSVSFLLYLLPAAIISGPFVPDLIISITSIFFLIVNFINKDFKYFNNLLIKLFLIFYLYLVIISIFINPKIIFYIRFVIFSLAIWQILEFNNDFKKYFFQILTLTVFILCLDGLLQYFNDTNILGMKAYTTDRISGLFGDKGRLGSYVARLFPLGLVYFICYEKKKNYNLALPLYIIICFIIVLLSGERVALFLIGLSFIFVFFYFKKKFISNTLIILIILSLFSLFINFDANIKNRIITNTKNQMNLNSLNKDKVYIFSDQHEKHYKIAINMFKTNILFGHGAQSFRKLCSREDIRIDENSSGCTTHPHNIYLQLLAETGLFGFLFLLFFSIKIYHYLFLCFFKKFTNGKLNNEYFFLINVALGVNLFPFIPTGNLFNNWMSILLYLPLGFYLKEKINCK